MSSLFAIPAVPTPLPPGSCVGPYVIKSCLGDDLDGFDYAAEERHSGREVLLREGCPVGLVQRAGLEVVPLPGAEADFREWLSRWSGLLDHWQRASRASDPARLGHCALVMIEDRGEARGTAWVGLCAVGGRHLRQVVEDGPGWPGRTMVDAGLHTCCGAVEALHRHGEVHGSLTPERVQVLDNGAWCLLLPDSDPFRQPLSPWLALEQTDAGRAAGLATGPWTDVHGIASLAHWLLTGSAPPSIARRQAEGPDCWAELERVERDPLRLRALRSALAVRPADRLGSVAALRMALGWSERHVPVAAEVRKALPPPPPPAPPPVPIRRSRAGLVAMAGLLVSFSAVFSLLWINMGSSEESDAPEPTVSEAPAAVGSAAPAQSVPPSIRGAVPVDAASVAGVASVAAAVPIAEPAEAKVKPKPKAAASAAASPGRPEPAPVQTAAAHRRKTSDACIDWLRRRSLEPAGTERERNPACE